MKWVHSWTLDNMTPFLENIFPQITNFQVWKMFIKRNKDEKMSFYFHVVLWLRENLTQTAAAWRPETTEQNRACGLFWRHSGSPRLSHTRLNLNVWNLRVSLIVQSKQHRRPPGNKLHLLLSRVIVSTAAAISTPIPPPSSPPTSVRPLVITVSSSPIKHQGRF